MKKILLLLLPILFYNCSSDPVTVDNSCESRLPPATQVGANTFGCCINGNLFIPRSGTGTWGGSDYPVLLFSGYPEDTDYYELDIRDLKSETTSRILIHMHKLDSIGIGDYVINESNGSSSIDGLDHTYLHGRTWSDNAKNYIYYRSLENSGLLKITRYDFKNRIISGVLTCKVQNSADPDEILEINDLRFDIKWDTAINHDFP